MKNLTKQLLLAVCLTSAFSSASFAEEAAAVSPISANVTIASDYIWRGVTQTTGKKAIQGGFDWDAGNGFALGVWGSNADWATGMSAEFDIYGSYAGELSDGVGYEVGYISYTYNTDDDFKEAYIGGSYGDFGLTYYIAQGDANDNYIEGSYGTTVNDVDVSLTLGQYGGSGVKNGVDYKVYGLSLGKSYAGLDYALSFTKIKDGSKGITDRDADKANTVFSISKSF